MGRMMYIAKDTKCGKYVSVDNISDANIDSITEYTKIRAGANAKKVLCNEQAPFICPSCKKPVYFRRKSKKYSATFCHYASENDCSGKVRADVLKRIFIQMLADNAMHKANGLYIKSLSDTMMLPKRLLSFCGSSVGAHSYGDGILLSDWNVELYGKSDDKVVSRVQADLTLVRGNEYIFICFDEEKKGIVNELISENVYCTLFKVCWSNNINLSNLLEAFENIRSDRSEDSLCSLQFVTSPQLYFFNKSRFFAQADSSVICPASDGTYIVDTSNCVNCPCKYSVSASQVDCFGKLALSSSALLSQANIFDKFTKEAIADRFDVFIRDDTDQKPVNGVRKEEPNVFGICDECGATLELRGGLDMKPVKGIEKIAVHGKGLYLYCPECKSHKELKCHCGGAIIPYVNTHNGTVFVGCEDRNYSNSGIGHCESESLTVFTDENCNHLADEIIVARSISLWAQGKKKVLKRLAEKFPRYARLVKD